MEKLKLYSNKWLLPALIGLSYILPACSGNAEKKATTMDTGTIAKVKEVADSLLLTPGVSAGIIKINADADSLVQILGKPDAGDAAMQKAVSIWYYNHDLGSYGTAVYSARDTGEQPVARIQQIRITSPEFSTKERFSVGSKIVEISKIFPVKELPEFKIQGKDTSIYDSLEGIAFEVDGKGICTAIIIHKAKEPLQGTYLTFR